MRLLNAETPEIRGLINRDSIPPYAILSHTWADEEVSFQEWQDIAMVRHKTGFAKFLGACAQTLRDGFEGIWVDTNCIDKTSSAELSEAINSMFAWYHNAKVCYVYLVDVDETAACQTCGNDDSDN